VLYYIVMPTTSKRKIFMRLMPVLLAAGLLIAVSCTDDNEKPPVGPGGGNGGGDGTGVVFLGSPPVVINEIYSANADFLDEFGGDPGWVEFYNPADTVVNLNGYYFTNSASRKQWAFGNVAVEPRGYLLVFLSGRDMPNREPPRDSIDLLGGSVGAWTWADSQNTPVAGRSSAYHQFSRNPPGLSGTLNARDNSGGLGWTTAVVFLKFTNWGDTSIIDLSRSNQILLRGFLSEGLKLELRLPQTGIGDWQGWPAVITGTGKPDDFYTVELPFDGSANPDFNNIYGIRLGNTSEFRGTIEFNFNSVVARKKGGNVHAPFELSSRGGSLYLLDSEGYIRDSAAYPAGRLGLSYAKRVDDGAWALSKPPTPNSANSSETYTGIVQPPTSASIPASGYYGDELTFTLPRVNDDIYICCDTTGSIPVAGSGVRSGVAVTLTKTTMMLCAQFMDGAYQSDPVMRTYIIGEPLPSLPVVSIAVNQYDMFSYREGLYSKGPNASGVEPYYGANFWRDDELPIHIDFMEGGAKQMWSHPAGIRIFGNWSRMHYKKSVVITFREEYGVNRLRYGLFPDYPHLTTFKHFILRNNGNNFPQDYIRDMLMTSLTDGLGIDYQKGRSVLVYFNGVYWGIHNLRERANGDYFETNYGINEDYIDLVKASGEVSRGSDADYQDILRWVGGRTLTNDDLVLLDQRFDIDNFTYNHMCRIYYNDRDWPGNNIKRWRENAQPSRWKWLMYDTDHGFGSYGTGEQSHLGALAFATRADGPDWPNPPHTTLMLRKLLENKSYKNTFINRFSLIIATYFAPERVSARINALMAPIESEIPRDQERWMQNVRLMSSQLDVIRNFGRNRPEVMRKEIEEFFGLSGAVDFAVSAGGNGNVLIDNLQVLNGSATFKAYPSVPVTVKAVSNPGAVFEGWSDGVAGTERVVNVDGPVTLEARFGPASF